jgi:phage-related protein
MAFDAGAIVAHARIDQTQFDRDLDSLKAKSKAFENEPHRVKFTAEMDQSGIARTRKMFADLDNQISRDAASRMRSGSSGSLLGTLMGLTTPHQVAGLPTGQQAAQQGLLGKLFSSLPKGGGGGSGIGSFLGSLLGGHAGGDAAAVAAAKSNNALLARLAAASIGGGTGGQSNLLKGLGSGIGPGILGIGAKGAGIVGLGGSLLGALPALAAPLAALGVGGAGVGLAGALGSQALKGITPLLSAQSAAQQALAQATTPAQVKAAQQQLAGVQAALKQQPAALQTIFASLSKLQSSWQKFTASLAPALVGPIKVISKVFTGLLPDIRSVFSSAMTLVVPFIKGIGDIAHMVLPLLGQAFRAVAPLMRPLLDGLGKLVAGILPGLTTLLRAAMPAVTVFGKVMGTLGHDLGGLFANFAPVLRSSAVIFKALFDLIGSLLPIIGELAAIFAKTLAPAFSIVAGLIRALEPTLTLIGKIMAQLAAAVLGDLVSALGALVTLVKGIEPALHILAATLGTVFKVLENAGVFAILGDALEAIAKPLANLINGLVRGLAPFLPGIIGLVSSLAGTIVKVLAAGVEALLPPLLMLANILLKALRPILPPIEKALTQLGAAIGQALVQALKALLPSLGLLLASLLKIIVALLPILPPLVQLAAILIELALKAVSPLFPLLALLARLIADIITPVADLLAGIVKFATQWKSSWTDIKHWASDAWSFIWNGFGKFLLPLLGPVGLIALGAIELAKHWHAVLADVKGDADDAWRHLVSWGDDIRRLFTNTIPGYWDDFWSATKNRLISPLEGGLDNLVNWVHNHFTQPIINIFTNTIPNAFRTFINIATTVMGRIEGAMRGPVDWVIKHVLNGLIGAFDWISGKVGGPHINPIPALATGGRIPGYGGGDKHLVLTEGGEAVVSKETTAAHAAELRRWGVPGFASGGKIGQNPPGSTGNPHLPQGEPNPGGGIGGFLGGLFHKIADVGKIIAAVTTGNSKALTNAIVSMIPGGVGGAVADMAQVLTDIPKKLISEAVTDLISVGGGLGGNGGDIVKYAMSFLGKVPYVWGGTAVPGGADCSGFVQTIYKHFGIDAPRTSEAQGAWVKRGPPTAGGLAFYHSPPGGPDPGHVAIVRNATSVISQGGGLGPQLMGLHGLPLLWTGVPPGGLGSGGLGRAGLRPLENLWMGAGGPGGSVAHIAGAIALAESGGNANARNPSGADGLWQILGQVVAGNIFNPHINALNAVKKWRDAGGFSPWVTYETGAYRQFMDRGGWWMPGQTYQNASGQPEAVFTSSQSRAMISLADAADQGHLGGSGLMRDVYIQLPEGTTVAQALNELKFQLKVAELQGFAGVSP